MIKRSILLLLACLLIVSACSSDNNQERVQSTAPADAMESIDSSLNAQQAEPTNSELLKHKKAPIILINPDDDDMTRLD